MVFQDPFSSLNPQRPLFDQVAEPLRNYGTVKREVLQEKIGDLFDRVKLPRSFMQRSTSTVRWPASADSNCTCASA